MTGPLLRDVVVGLDGSPAAERALRWAAGAMEPGRRLHAVHVILPVAELACDAMIGDSVAMRHRHERELADDWLTPVGDAPLDLEPIVREGRVAASLIAVADEVGADAIVVGHHPRGRFGPRLVGHVTSELLRKSARPVVVVPEGWEPSTSEVELPVVVGVGVAAGTDAAIRWTVGRPSDVDVSMVHAFGHRSLFRPGGMLDVLAFHLDPGALPGWVEEDLTALAAEIRRDAVVAVGGDAAPAGVAVTVTSGRIGRALVDAGERARVLVIGRGEPPFVRGNAIAPYLRHAITHATCPVVVVPAGPPGV